MKFYIYTLGCKVNQYESEAISEIFVKNGYSASENSNEADIIIINSCSVTAESDRKARQAVRRFRKNSPNAVIALCGCYPEGNPTEAKKLLEADIIMGNGRKNGIFEKVVDYINNKKRNDEFQTLGNAVEFESMTVTSAGNRLRAAVKIEDGCNSFCSYCIIPYVRGRVRSKPENEAIEEIRKLAESGIKEIVLSGIHLDRYGTDNNESDLTSLLEKLDRIKCDFRIRLSSLDPVYITEETVKRLSVLKKLCPHFHLSLQSGSDSVLRAMNRKYTSAQYKNAVSIIKRYLPEASVTTDIITGFPGETEKDFEDSVNIVKSCEFLKVHVFPYSERPGTRAAEMKNSIPKELRSKRANILIRKADEVSQGYLSGFIGKEAEVLVEEIKNGTAYGYTKNYIYTSFSAENVSEGDIVAVTLQKLNGDSVLAALCK